MESDYTGLGATGWLLDPLDQPGPDFPFFLELLRSVDGPVLDVGCGAGRLLIPLKEHGIEIEGIEPSTDMRSLCRRRAAERAISVVVHDQAMQNLQLPHRFAAIIVPCGTIHLLVQRDEMREGLKRAYQHLRPGGLLVVIVYNSWAQLDELKTGEWLFLFKAPLPDGSEFAKWEMLASWDEHEQVARIHKRYERYREDDLVEEQVVDAPERWYRKHEMELILKEIGMRDVRVTSGYTANPARDGDEIMSFLAWK
jgi:SAM-dependent methyltransferase